MKDLVIAATSGLFVEVGKIIEHMKAQQERIAELETKLQEQDAMLGRRPCINNRCMDMVSAQSRIAELERENARLDAALDEEIGNRDQYHEWADRLAAEIARYFGVDIGEHSNANNPWEQAYEAVPAEASAPAVEQQPVASDGWLIDGSLVYKLDPTGTMNAFEINVTQAEGSRKSDGPRVELAKRILVWLAAPQAADTDKVREAIEILQGALVDYACHPRKAQRKNIEAKALKAVAKLVATMAAQAPVREVPVWQPIETAPKDGSEVLLWLPAPYSRIAKACWFDLWENWQEGEEMPNFNDEYCGIGCNLPTHWMPLPAAPVHQEGDRG